MPIPVTGVLDMGQNQIIHLVIHGGADFPISPAPINGQLFFKTGANQGFYYFDNAAWRPVGDITGVNATAGGGLTGGASSGEVNLVVNTDGTTLEINSGTNQVRIKAGGVAANELASNAVTTVKIQDGAVTLGKIGSLGTMTLVGRVSGGTGAAEAISIINDGTLAAATSTNIATAGAVKTYVDNRLSSLGSLIDAFNASTSTTFPVNPSGGTKKGDYWYVTVAGTVQGVPLNVGDVIMANKANASTTLPADWIFIESNRDQATETVLGVIALASQTEVNAGSPGTKAVTPVTLAARTATESRTGLIAIATTGVMTNNTDNDSTAVTPLKLVQYLNSNQLNQGFNIPGTSIVAGGTVTVTHGLNTRDLNCDLWRISDNQLCIGDITAPTLSTVVVTFGQAQSANSFRLVIGRR